MKQSDIIYNEFLKMRDKDFPLVLQYDFTNHIAKKLKKTPEQVEILFDKMRKKHLLSISVIPSRLGRPKLIIRRWNEC